MKYENPHIPEGINTSPEHPLRTFFMLSLGLLVVISFSAWLLGIASGFLAKQVSWEQELQLAGQYAVELEETVPTGSSMQRYLQSLSNRVAKSMQLPEEMNIKVGYVDDGLENAFATLGGHVFFFRGLLERLDSENALAMLLAHEIGHIRHRDPIVSVGQGAAISLGTMLLLHKNDAQLLSSAGLLTQMNFGRDMERAADEIGLQAVNELYGHVGGALDLYRVLGSLSDDDEDFQSATAFFATHPASRDRLDDLQNLAEQKNWPLIGELTPLPADFEDWLSAGY